MTRVAAFDVGSTNLRSAVGTTTGELTTDVYSEPTEPERLIEQIVEGVEALWRQTSEPLDAVSVASTGLVDHERGVVEKFDARDPDRNRYDLDVTDAVSSRCGLPVTVENDVNAATLGEYRFGLDRAPDAMVYLNVGSGIGAGIVSDRALVRGEHGHAGEVGMIPVAGEPALEASGVPGAWEAYCSGEGIKGFVRSKLADEDRETVLGSADGSTTHEATAAGGPTAEDLFAAVRAGDAVAEEYLAAVNEYNAAAVAALGNVLDPGAVVFGGSVVLNNPDLTVDAIRADVDRRLLVADPDLRVSALGSRAGLLGALALVDR